MVTLPIRVKQEEEGGHPGGQPPVARVLPTIKVEPVEEVVSAPGVSNTFPMVLPIFKPGTLLESVCTVQYHISRNYHIF